jgi:hypothetical protein
MKLPCLTLAAFLLGSLATFPSLHAADLSDADKQFLTGYEHVRAALAKDNLDETKKAAVELGNDAAAIAKADSIATARNEFAILSERAIKLASGQSGYYVVNCPMLKKDWVQPSGEISNPYAGRSMPNCGVIKKK